MIRWSSEGLWLPASVEEKQGRESKYEEQARGTDDTHVCLFVSVSMGERSGGSVWQLTDTHTPDP